MAALVEAGLADDEAFLVAVKRMGNLDAISRDFAYEHSERMWKQLALVHGCSGTLQEVASIHSRRARLSTTQYWDEVAGPSEVQDQISRPQLGRA